MSTAVKCLTKSEAKTPRGIMRLAERIIEEGLPQPSAKTEVKSAPGLSRTEQLGLAIDPNAYRTRYPFSRVRNPREEPKRRPAGWTDCRFILPQLTLDGLRALTIQLAHDQQNSDWPGERGRYAKTKNYYVVWALNELFKRLGFGDFCVQEQKPHKRRVRRFVAPTT